MSRYVFASLLFVLMVFVSKPSVAVDHISNEVIDKAGAAFEQSQKNAADADAFFKAMQRKEDLCQKEATPDNCSSSSEAAVLLWSRDALVKILSFKTFHDVLATKDLFTEKGWEDHIVAMSRGGYINPKQQTVLVPLLLSLEDIEFNQDYVNADTDTGHKWVRILKIKNSASGLLAGMYAEVHIMALEKKTQSGPVAGFKIEQYLISSHDPRKR